jgi:DNA excision repair protein ERCC-4
MIGRHTIVIDTREQTPYSFDWSITGTLKTGDYSLLGCEEEICIERKSASDAYGTIGAGRDRFRRELERMAQMRYAAIVVEATLYDFVHAPPQYSALNPKAAIGSLLAWSVKYGVHVFFAGDRAHGQAVTGKLLSKFWQYKQEGKL